MRTAAGVKAHAAISPEHASARAHVKMTIVLHQKNSQRLSPLEPTADCMQPCLTGAPAPFVTPSQTADDRHGSQDW